MLTEMTRLGTETEVQQTRYTSSLKIRKIPISSLRGMQAKSPCPTGKPRSQGRQCIGRDVGGPSAEARHDGREVVGLHLREEGWKLIPASDKPKKNLKKILSLPAGSHSGTLPGVIGGFLLLSFLEKVKKSGRPDMGAWMSYT